MFLIFVRLFDSGLVDWLFLIVFFLFDKGLALPGVYKRLGFLFPLSPPEFLWVRDASISWVGGLSRPDLFTSTLRLSLR